MSGSAIASLQSQALKPIEKMQKRFWKIMEDVGEILEQFLKFFYTEKKFKYFDKDKVVMDTFNSSDYESEYFDCTCNAIAGTLMSDVSSINLLENLFNKGAISLKTFIDNYPNNAVCNKENLLKSINEEEQNQINALQNQLKECQNQVNVLSQELMQKNQIVDKAQSIIDENNRLKEKLILLQSEYSTKINKSNEILNDLVSKAREYKNDSTLMATKIAKDKGLI
ncbi:MAG: hypothetical protein IJW82_07505 [Clostridia bacterium]|nr:hypothetical protein [Clostridia bacterium]